ILQSKRRYGFERLEDRRVLAIAWANEFGSGSDDPDFDIHFTASEEVVVRSIINRAIDDWETVINSFNYDSPALNDTFSLKVFARELSGRGSTTNRVFEAGSQKPISANISIDDD